MSARTLFAFPLPASLYLAVLIHYLRTVFAFPFIDSCYEKRAFVVILERPLRSLGKLPILALLYLFLSPTPLLVVVLLIPGDLFLDVFSSC